MNFPTSLIPGRLERRYKRFLADVVLEDGTLVTAHCANSGALWGVQEAGTPVLLSRSTNPARKLGYTWEMALLKDTWVGVNTQHPNRLVAEALQVGAIAELTGYATHRPEVVVGAGTRLDFCLEGHTADPRPCYLEVKNVHMMREAGRVEFPDAITTRGAKHLQTLLHLKKSGARAALLYIVQRGDGVAFSVAADIDPTYAQLFKEVQAAGVEILCYDCTVLPTGITLRTPISIEGA